jgi:hypothetical protein
LVLFEPERDRVTLKTSAPVGWWILVLAQIGLIVYNRWVIGGRTGQTWGRKMVRIRLQSEETGEPIGIGRTIKRDFAHIVDGFPWGIGALWPLWDARRQTFADKTMNTVVVNV